MANFIKTYYSSLPQRDRRAIGFGVIAVIVICVYLLVALPFVESWTAIRGEIKTYQANLDAVNIKSASNQAKIIGLYKTVPCLEMPQDEDAQRKLFWEKTYDQLKSAGVGVASGPSYLPVSRKKTIAGYNVLKLRFTGACKYDQLLKFFVSLNENPYLVSIEDFSVNEDPKKQGQVSFDMTLETLTR